jgi:hypothetical protein
MDKAFWRRLIAANDSPPPRRSIAALTAELVGYLGSTDPELRDAIAYPLLQCWIHQQRYVPEQMRALAGQMLANMRAGLGEVVSDTIFLRAFSVLILRELTQEDNDHPYLREDEVRIWLEAALTYLAAERDLRGYVAEKGWAHAVAHTADWLRALAQNRFLAAHDLERILDAIAAKIGAPVAYVYLHLEDERLALAVCAALRRDLLHMDFLAAWLDRLAHPLGGQSWIEAVTTPEGACVYHNAATFLRSLYFQLTLGADPPAIASDLTPGLLAALRTLDVGFYRRP